MTKTVFVTDRQAVDQLFIQGHNGDRTLAQLIKYMKCLVGDRRVDNSLFCHLWHCRLLSNIQQNLVVGDTDANIYNIAKLAGEI